MALTQAQIDAFEKMRVGYWDRILGKTGEAVLTGEQYTLLALQTISDQLATLTRAMTGETPATAPVGGVTVNTEISLSLPLTAKEINQFLLITPDTRGYITAMISQAVAMIPAAGIGGPGTLTFTYPVPPGYAIVATAPFRVSTDTVAAEISVSASVDGKSVINTNIGFYLGPPVDIAVDQYQVAVDTGVDVIFTNYTSSNVILYFYAEVMTIARSFYDSFYAKLLSFGYSHIRDNLGLQVK